MSKHKLEVTLKGEFTTVDVVLEGKEFPLKEIEDNIFSGSDSNYEIENPLDISVLLKGWTSQAWSMVIKVDDQEKFKKEGTFGSNGTVDFKTSVQIEE